MRILSLSSCSYQKALLIAVPLFCILSNIFRREVPIATEYLNQFLIILSMFFGDTLSFVFEIIAYFLQRAKKQRQSLNNSISFSKKVKPNKITKMIPKHLKKSQLVNYVAILCISIINFFVSIGLLYTPIIGGVMTTEFALKIVSILVTGLLSHFFFRYPLYIHQMSAIAFVFTAQIIIYFTGAIFAISDLIYIAIYCVVPIYTIIEKWLLDKRYVSPFSIVAWEGVFGLIITLLANYIRSIINCSNTFCMMLPAFSFKTFLSVMFSQSFYWLLILNYLFVNVGFSLINKYYNPNHRIASVTLVSVFNLFYQLFYIENYNDWYIALMVISNLLIMIGCIIYNEIIIVYICNMHYNTIEEIAYRSKSDVSIEELNQLNDDDNYDNENELI